MAKIGPKEQQRRDLREARADRPTWKGRILNQGIPPKTTNPTPPDSPRGKSKEATVTKKPTKKTTKKKPAKTAPKKKARVRTGTVAAEAGGAGGSSERPDGLRPGSKQAMMLDLAMMPGGKTEAEICAALGWKKCRVTLKRVCDKVGAVLTQTKNDKGVTVWSAAWKEAKAA
jgi:Protein of unknown function (DUF3489)